MKKAPYNYASWMKNMSSRNYDVTIITLQLLSISYAFIRFSLSCLRLRRHLLQIFKWKLNDLSGQWFYRAVEKCTFSIEIWQLLDHCDEKIIALKNNKAILNCYAITISI